MGKKLTLWIASILLLVGSCTTETVEESVLEQQAKENKITRDLKARLQAQLGARSDDPTFEETYGEVIFEEAEELPFDEETVIFPVSIEEDMVTSLLIGSEVVEQDTTYIQYHVAELKDSSFEVDLSLEDAVLFTSDGVLYSAPFLEDTNQTSRTLECSTTYGLVCAYVIDADTGESELLECRIGPATGTTCTLVPELSPETGTWEWLDPFPDDEPTGGNDDPSNCGPGQVWNNITQTCEYTQSTPCIGDPIVNPTIAPSGGWNVSGGRFGNTRNSGADFHNGTDIASPVGGDLHSIYAGTVVGIRKTFSPGQYKKDSYGNYIIIESTLANGDKVRLRYNHLNTVGVVMGDTITQGQLIGLTGITGNAAAKGVIPHVHIGAKLKSGSNWVNDDPEKYMSTKFDSAGNPITPAGC